MAQIDCTHFSGYKPCGLFDKCDENCPHYIKPSMRILVVHLEAMGAVLRSTALLPAIQRSYPDCEIIWLTKAFCKPLLQNNPNIHRVVAVDKAEFLSLEGPRFDLVLTLDKSMMLAGILERINFKELRGFKVDSENHSIVPANPGAQELWEVGLSDHIKFNVNRKPETQLAAESLGLDYKRDSYSYFMTEAEEAESLGRRQAWLGNSQLLIGINTGCSDTIPYKKLSVQGHRTLIAKLKSLGHNIVLLGGPSDAEANARIAEGLDVILSPTNKGLRDGFLSVGACDLVVSGDSLGMHMAIALKKWVVAWFGPTCDHEIDLFERGRHMVTKAPCSPCWKRSCHKDPMCYDLVDFDEMLDSCREGIQWLSSSFKAPSLETPS